MKLLLDASTAGPEGTDALIHRARTQVDQMAANSEDARDAAVRNIIERLAVYIRKLIQRMLKLVPAEIQVAGGRKLNLDAVDVTQTITCGGTIEVSLSAAIEFTASGQLYLGLKYASLEPLLKPPLE